MRSRSGVVLAGGRSARMGEDKALLRFNGLPLVLRAVDAIAPLCREVLVMGGAVPSEALGAAVSGRARVLGDSGQGPLAAIVVAAREAVGDVLVIAPCDAPLLTSDVYGPLLDAIARGAAAACYQADGSLQPLVCVARREDVERKGSALLDSGRRAARDLWTQMGVCRVPVERGMMALLTDVDTPAEWAGLRQSS